MAKNKVDISIIILNYNAGDFLLKCIQSIEQADLCGLKIEVIVVDNNSSDGSLEQLKTKDLRLVKNKKNIGFSAGNNVGVREASGKYVLFLNPDTVLSKNSLRETFDFMEENKSAGACSAYIRLSNGEIDESSHRGFPTPWNAFTHFSGLEKVFPKSRLFSGYTMGWLRGNKKIHEVESINGAYFFIRREAGEEVSWWDEDFFWYGDDLDFCYRLKKKGWRIFFLPHVNVIHYKGVTSGIKKHSQKISTASRETRIRSTKASVEAMKIFYKKHYLDKYPRFITAIVFLGMGILVKFRIVKMRLF